MRKILTTITAALSLGAAVAAAPALGDVSTTQQLPAAACHPFQLSRARVMVQPLTKPTMIS